MKSVKVMNSSDKEINYSKPKGPRKFQILKKNTEENFRHNYILLSKSSSCEIKKSLIPQYKLIGCLLNDKYKENIQKSDEEKNLNNNEKIVDLENLNSQKTEYKNETQVIILKQTNINTYFKKSKGRKNFQIEKYEDDKILRPSSKKRKINKI